MTGEAAATAADTGEAKAAKGDQEAAGGAATAVAVRLAGGSLIE